MRVGFVTIGQSPRVDVVPEIKPYLGAGVEIIECGALDDLTLEEIKKLAPKEGDYVLVTRLRDGTQVRLSREKIIKRLQECIKKLEERVDVIGVLCTGEFPELTSRKLLVEPSLLLLKTVEALNVSNLGVIVPDPDQVEITKRKWEGVAKSIKVRSVSPYVGKEDEFIRAAQELKECDLIVMDCIGYKLSFKEIVKEITKKPVVLPRTLMARVIGELLEG
ncbi:AroM family protein [Pyrococcus kukulkanii]|uniref:AroM family protein n=1 Tax=Pyrococcus kukulkanii TaxID=1609559 RepID=UPI0035646860